MRQSPRSRRTWVYLRESSEEEPLAKGAPELAHCGELWLGLHPFGDGFDVEGIRHRNDGSDGCSTFTMGA